MPKHSRRLDAFLIGTAMPTTTVVYDTDEPLECAVCERPIAGGGREFFTRALAEGFGHKRVPHCWTCRMFQVRQP